MLLPTEPDLGNMNLKMLLEMRNNHQDLHVRLSLYYCCLALHIHACCFAFFPADIERGEWQRYNPCLLQKYGQALWIAKS